MAEVVIPSWSSSCLFQEVIPDVLQKPFVPLVFHNSLAVDARKVKVLCGKQGLFFRPLPQTTGSSLSIMHPTEENLIPRLILHSDSKLLAVIFLPVSPGEPIPAHGSTHSVQADPPLLSDSSNIAVKWEEKKFSSFQSCCSTFCWFLGLCLQTGAQETEVPVCFGYDRRSQPQPHPLCLLLCLEESIDHQALAAAGFVHGQWHSARVCTYSPCIFPTVLSWLWSSQGR